MNETIGQEKLLLTNFDKPKNFALIGVGGYIAPRHLQAIKDTGNNLVAALDPKDSVGIIDRYFPQANFFTEFERFERHIEKLRRMDQGSQIDYVSICSPNYLHDSHMRFALRMGAHAICEKPLVIRPWNLEALSQVEKEYGKGKIYTILQLRVHPTLADLKKKIESEVFTKKKEIDLTYITPRGKWYLESWKGDIEKSGGVAMNIGIHFFDMLIWIFGKPQNIELHYSDDTKASGYLELEKARVRWFLSTDANDLPEDRKKESKAYRLITIDGQELEFSEGFTDLHTEVYRRTLAGNGFGIEDVRPAINIVYELSKLTPNTNSDFLHPFLSPKKIEVVIKQSVINVVGQSVTNITRGENVVIGENVSVGNGTVIGNNVVIHKDTIIGENVRIDDNAVIGKLPMISINSAITSKEALWGTRIGSGTMIGTGAVVYRSSSIGENALIADTAQVRELVEIGSKTIIGKGTVIENKVKIGNCCKIQANVQIVPYSIIEDYVFISPGVMTSNDKYAARTERRFSEYKGVTVKRGARLGVACTILPGVTIYEDALVGGGAVVMEDVPARMIVVGVPARVIKEVPAEQLLDNQKGMNTNPSCDFPMQKIPYVDVRANYQSLKNEIDTSINKIVSEGHFIMGDEVKNFEEEISSYLGSRAISCASGSDALLLSLMALGIGPGDEVITSPFTFFATAGAIARLGAKPVFVDIEERTLNMDPDKLRSAINQKTKAIIPVHIFGYSCDMDRIMSVAREFGLKVIEDACQAIGAEYKGRKLGTIGDLGAFSFFPTKNLGGMGDGGLVCTNSEELYQKVKMLRVHGAEKKYFHDLIGINSRLDTLQAAILRVKLEHLDTWNRKRGEISNKYRNALSNVTRVQDPLYGSVPCYHQFAIRVEKRDELLNFLKENGIEASVYYPRPLHIQKCFEYLGYKVGDLPVSESVCNSVLSLPLFPEMTEEQINFIILKVREFLSTN
jgi:UDP-N-acetyl-2-amino-2-deoxyglucuronate dehydrogenase